MSLGVFNPNELLQPVQRKDVQQTRDIAKKGALVQKDTAVTMPTNTQYAHGPSGFANQPGVDRNVISMIQRMTGLSSELPMRPSIFVNPLFKMLTAQAATSGNEASDVCSKAPTPGKISEMHHTAPFGRLLRDTETMTLDRVGEYLNNAEPFDLSVIGDTIGNSPWIPDPAKDLDLRSELRVQYWRLGIDIERKMELDFFQGAGASQGTTNGYVAPYGLDSLINTGKTDAVTGMAVPAADSTILAWGGGAVDASVTVQSMSMDIVDALSRLFKFMERRAELTGQFPILWKLGMRYDLFWELTAMWPCSYLTNNCSAASTSKILVTTGREQVDMRDEMRNGRFLWINGIKVPVVISNGIAETAAAPTGKTDNYSKSDIYLLPYIAGGLNSLYIEHLDYNNPALAELIRALIPGLYTVSNSGLFVWTPEKGGFCTYFKCMNQSRIILRHGFLAARITGVAYKSALHTLDGNPSALYPTPGGGSTVGQLYSTLYPLAI